MTAFHESVEAMIPALRLRAALARDADVADDLVRDAGAGAALGTAAGGDVRSWLSPS